MTKSRAKNEQGQFVGDNPSTPDVNEAWVETPSETSKEDESLSANPVVTEPVEEPAGSEPAAVQLRPLLRLKKSRAKKPSKHQFRKNSRNGLPKR